MYPYRGIGQLLGGLFWLLFITAAVSFWFRNDFAEPAQRTAALQKMDLSMKNGVPEAPLQRPLVASSFEVEQKGIRYSVSPLYDYTLQGVVVSLKAHDGNYGLHRRWGDHLNIADFCVVWGENASSLNLNELGFWNGQFTCNVEPDNSVVWREFRPDQLSNNHLLVTEETLRSEISKTEVGDVIIVRGTLAEYINGSGGRRGTSTVRTDAGNGACETIFVEDVRRLGDVRTYWYPLFWYSLWGSLVVGVLWVFGVVRGYY